jgi:hypothetical protein
MKAAQLKGGTRRHTSVSPQQFSIRREFAATARAFSLHRFQVAKRSKFVHF